MKLVSIVGARPQFIKAGAFERCLNTSWKHVFKSVLVHTGQHFDHNMSTIFFEEMDMRPPDHFLGIGGDSQGAMTGKMIEALESVLLKEQPHAIIVFGDTNSTLAGAIAAAKIPIPIAHIEAGLRSFNTNMPEEINRRLTDHCSTWLFTPAQKATEQLQKEGIPSNRIFEVGDIMYESSLHFLNRAYEKSTVLENHALRNKDYVLATIHRAENTDNPEILKKIVSHLSEIAKCIPVIFPLHPRTKKALAKSSISVTESIKIVEPLGYLDMIRLEKSAHMIITDSGGVQKEAYFFHTPCLVVRKETEWVELIECGAAHLAIDNLYAAFQMAQEKKIDWQKEIYGSGDTSSKILSILSQFASAQ